MKKLFFLFAFLGLFAFAANAQKKACCASKTAAAKVSCTTSADADKAAAEDASIVKQVSNTGDVTYTRKSVCPTSGKVSYTDVEYCSKSGKFINVSPSEKAAACSKSASATKVSSTSKKACCAKGASKAGCSDKKAEKASTEQSEGDAKVKLVSEEGN